eukprot:6074916-Pyramimonas_sp.AAC.1
MMKRRSAPRLLLPEERPRKEPWTVSPPYTQWSCSTSFDPTRDGSPPSPAQDRLRLTEREDWLLTFAFQLSFRQHRDDFRGWAGMRAGRFEMLIEKYLKQRRRLRA